MKPMKFNIFETKAPILILPENVAALIEEKDGTVIVLKNTTLMFKVTAKSKKVAEALEWDHPT